MKHRYYVAARSITNGSTRVSAYYADLVDAEAVRRELDAVPDRDQPFITRGVPLVVMREDWS